MTEFSPSSNRPPSLTKSILAAEPIGAASSPRILVVEDDFLISLEIESTLAGAGFEVVVVGSGEEALNAAAANRVDLVIMDMRLAGAMDGVEAATELFKTYGLRSVFATAHSDQHVRARAAAAQPLGWLVKPYSPASLLAAVQAALGGAGN
ncbi:response regulator [Mesorhizobium sp. B4-1-3]|uniref:response regulator n=1 Tax=Mesorhizobium sp. B4-1-3 TaxID=2589889 RepID=UPI001125FD6F|nr:response regulator [Mesorhizobium sp. B4-1-3]TPI08733.1 response regulator [Mesorhizobium sp. B4-1-3]